MSLFGQIFFSHRQKLSSNLNLIKKIIIEDDYTGYTT